MVLAIVPAAPPTRKNRRATSWPAPISAKVPYLVASRLIRRAFSSVPISISGSIQFLLRRFLIAANRGSLQGAAAWAAVDFRHDGWEAVSPWRPAQKSWNRATVALPRRFSL